MVAFFFVTGVEPLQQPFQGYPQARTGGRELYLSLPDHSKPIPGRLEGRSSRTRPLPKVTSGARFIYHVILHHEIPSYQGK